MVPLHARAASFSCTTRQVGAGTAAARGHAPAAPPVDLRRAVPTSAPAPNPAGNIWSHLAPALFMLVLALGGELQVWQGAAAAYYANVLSIAACFLGSVAYHTLMAHHHHHDTLLKLDVSGPRHAAAVQGGRRGAPVRM